MEPEELQALAQVIQDIISPSGRIPRTTISHVRTLPPHWKLSNLDYRFLKASKIECDLSYGAELPSVELFKNCLNFYITTSKGKLYDKPTVGTLLNAYGGITTYLQRKAGKKYSRHDLDDLYCVCEPFSTDLQLLRFLVHNQRFGCPAQSQT